MENILWDSNEISKLVLGTAQLGMDYGIANAQGRPTEKAAYEIVAEALDNGINCFDTAQVYGDSEVVLGKCLKRVRRRRMKIVSKLSSKLEPSNGESVKQSVRQSCQNLGVDRLWGLMLHQADWLALWDEGLGETLKNSGNVKYLGVSVYSVEDARRALQNPDVQIVQVPCNIWDQRMKTEGIFKLAEELNKLIFVRSVYLQGLLLMSVEQVRTKLPWAIKASQQWHKLAEKYGLKPLELAAGFAKSLRCPLVIGAESSAQVTENCSLFEKARLPEGAAEDVRLQMAPLLSDEITNPSYWEAELSGR